MNAFMAKQALDQLSPDSLDHLGGDEVESWQSLDQQTGEVDANRLPKRLRNPGQEPEPFFLGEGEDTVPGLESPHMGEEAFEETDQASREQQSAQPEAPSLLGDAEDTIID